MLERSIRHAWKAWSSVDSSANFKRSVPRSPSIDRAAVWSTSGRPRKPSKSRVPCFVPASGVSCVSGDSDRPISSDFLDFSHRVHVQILSCAKTLQMVLYQPFAATRRDRMYLACTSLRDRGHRASILPYHRNKQQNKEFLCSLFGVLASAQWRPRGRAAPSVASDRLSCS
jgi:hypothetical protein